MVESGCRKTRSLFFSLSSAQWRRVALLGIAQRRISIKFSHKLRKQNHAKPLPESIQTIGDWIQVKRHEKNLTSAHLATKMGIATNLIRSWEAGTSQPDKQQLKVLASLFGNDADFDPTQKNLFL
jgi:ribosome-binding protein aMBF1 (putative translation factor)